ncbi:SHOCT domain-containing protein [Isoptericola sediminis]|uniref:SHOCT domain-containing protein n=1 Tax=Isoptericola sediminis TaxID=2733572 RepID=A0A849K2D9_9MICO|nr:SHOCT domain-containing protein [Isoptericola sediminis]NNU26229.1 hypothetical protein [Isoptericola sediminis]
MTWLYLALLVLGVALLAVVGVRVLVGGIRPNPGSAGDDGRPPRRTERSSRTAARRLLDERYAAGELSTEEYDHRRRVLEG